MHIYTHTPTYTPTHMRACAGAHTKNTYMHPKHNQINQINTYNAINKINTYNATNKINTYNAINKYSCNQSHAETHSYKHI